ncbi:MAG TPA: hypothetical protein ENJ53_11125, partial [Phaeodactylibacter sp.]|nr:hypothetical protein [Phaeodactylibacter sp.]
MKKVLLLSLFSILALAQSFAQWGSCDPDLFYADSTFGVYPPPLSATNPDGGIPEKACQGEDFYFVWTIKIPETIETTTLTISVDSIVVAQSGAITNLPIGM